MNTLDLSIVIPVMNEKENIIPLVEKILSSLNTLNQSYEVILIDDGSTDGTVEEIKKATLLGSEVKSIIFRKNFGKSAALMAGFQSAEGKVVITMDGDLQDDPFEIPKLLNKLNNGYDLVSGWKKNRKDPIEKKLASKVFNFIVSRVTKVNIHDFNCGFKAYRSWCVKALKIRGNQHRFIPAILSWHGATISEQAVKHHKRSFGKSKYGIARYFHGTFDLLTLLLLIRFSQNPLYFFGIIGNPFMGFGAIIGLWLLVFHIAFLWNLPWGNQLNNRPLLLISFALMIIGLQIYLIGLLAELILRHSSIHKSYEIKETSEFEEL